VVYRLDTLSAQEFLYANGAPIADPSPEGAASASKSKANKDKNGTKADKERNGKKHRGSRR
jgi:hypothetical protein